MRALKGGKVLAGFAGSAADALTLFEKFEEKLERYPGNLPRAAVELAKDWRSDRVLRRLEALLVVADLEHGFLLSGTGELIEPDDGILAIGSGGNYALAAARALLPIDGLGAREIVQRVARDRRRHLRLHQHGTSPILELPGDRSSERGRDPRSPPATPAMTPCPTPLRSRRTPTPSTARPGSRS